MVEQGHPMESAKRLMRRELPRRFYKDVTVATQEGTFAVLLDGRQTRTPGKRLLAVADRAVAEALAAEWTGQGESIDPSTMPLTRLVNSALDRVAPEADRVREDIVKYAGSDLIAYRAGGPESLVAAQDAHWNPLVAWAKEALGLRLTLAVGVIHVSQDRSVSEAVAKAIASLEPIPLAALHVTTTLTGSVVIALSVLRRRLAPDQAWQAAHVDEDWQISQWGSDEIALAARADRRRDFDAAVFALLTT